MQFATCKRECKVGPKQIQECKSILWVTGAGGLLTARQGGEESELHHDTGISEAWGPPQFQEKRSRSERAILGALGEFRGILGAALGIGNSILGIRNSILGMASHELINTKPTIRIGATLGAIPGIAANPHEIFTFDPAFSERFFRNWGGPRAPEGSNSEKLTKSTSEKLREV